MCKRMIVMVVLGKRRKGKQKQMWIDSINHDLTETGLSGEEAQAQAAWRRLIPNVDPHKNVKIC